MKELFEAWLDNLQFFFNRISANIKNSNRIIIGNLRSFKAHLKYFFGIASPYFKALKSRGIIIWAAVCALLITGAVVVIGLTNNIYVVSYKGNNLGYSRNANIVHSTVARLQAGFADNSEIREDLSLFTATEIQTYNIFLKCLTATELENLIVNASESIDYAYSVYINGERRIAGINEETVNITLENFKKDRIAVNDKIYEGYESCEVQWLNGVEVKKECLPAQLVTRNDIYNSIYSVLENESEYKIVCVQTENVAIPYLTSYSRNDALTAGGKVVLNPGANGIKAVKKEVIFENGEIVSSKTISETVTKSSVTRRVQIGSGLAASGGLDSHVGLLLPVEGILTSGYGMRKDPFTKEPAHHNGLDIAAKKGTPIYASSAGRIIQSSDKKNGYGKCIIIEHSSGFRTLYGHCSELLVNVGDYVEAGQEIALVGSTGRSTGPHLHFSIIIDGKYVDPSVYF